MFWANQHDRSAKDEQERPSKADDAPWRLVFDVAVDNQTSNAINRECFLSKNHPGKPHPRKPQIIEPPYSPQAQQSQYEHHRKKLQPHFMDCVATIENEARRDRHSQRCDSSDVLTD